MATATLVNAAGTNARVYDVAFLAGDTTITIDTGLTFDYATITPNGASPGGCYTQVVSLGSITGSSVVINKTAGAAATARVVVGRAFSDRY